MDYDAITVDTQTVATNGFDLDGGLLAQLKQFRDGPTQVVVSEVVASEILKHLREHAKETKLAVESAHRKAILYGLKKKDEVAFTGAVDTDKLARDRLASYFEEVGAIVIAPGDVPLKDVLHMYFEALPPFAKAGKKKNEFPDAIALLSLQKWAENNKKKVLAVSGDADWSKFAANSKQIDVVTELSEALEILQADLEKAHSIISRLLGSIESGESANLRDQIEDLLRREVPNYAVYAEGDSSYQLEGDQCELIFKSFSFLDAGDDFRIVRAGPDEIVAQVELAVIVDASASFSLSIYDSVDKEYIGLGSVDARMEDVELVIDSLLTLEGDFEKGEVAVTNVELIGDGGFLNFGTIEPDYGEPDLDSYGEPISDDQDEGGW